MGQKLIKRNLNMGIIVSALALLLTTLVGGIGDIVSFINEIIRLSRSYSLFQFSGFFTLFGSVVFPFLTFVANLIFVFYVFKGYKNGKDLIGAVRFGVLIISEIFSFIYGLIAAFVFGNVGTNNILSYIWLFVSPVVAIVCYAVAAFGIIKNNKIVLLGATGLLCFGPLANLIYRFILYVGIYGIPFNFAIKNLGIFDFFITGIAALSLVAFAFFAFSKKDVIASEDFEENGIVEEV